MVHAASFQSLSIWSLSVTTCKWLGIEAVAYLSSPFYRVFECNGSTNRYVLCLNQLRPFLSGL